MNTLIFIVLHTLIFASGVMAFFGLGAMVCRQSLKSGRLSNPFRFGLMTTTGLGVSICVLQGLAIAGLLNLVSITALAAFGLVGAVFAIRNWSTSVRERHPLTTAEKIAYLVLIAVVLRTILMPFRPSASWDEVMYHLPHAAQWAESGTLSVNPWLRFPWFPYNYDLLYAAALLIWDDILAHLFHALAGWLCALMIYQVGLKVANRMQAIIATAIWLSVSDFYYGNAYIELGLSLFLFTACVAFWHWASAPKERSRWLFLAAFLLGVAAGSKYLPLIYLPLFVTGLLVIERRLQTVLLSALFFLLPCVYWYGRNLLLTGDPFSPFGGPLFGFHDWIAADLARQFHYTSKLSGWPSWLLWPALVVPFIPRAWRDFDWRLIVVFSIYAVASWYISTGGYVRFLTPAYPVLAIMSARGWVCLATTAGRKIGRYKPVHRLQARLAGPADRWVLLAVALIVAALASDKLVRDWSDIRVSAAERDAYLAERIDGYGVIMQLSQVPHTGIYQFGLESAIYYMPQPVWGDHFGPGRYRDMAALPPQALAAKLNSMDIDLLVINHTKRPEIAAKANFHEHFEEMISVKAVTVYRLKETRGQGDMESY